MALLEKLGILGSGANDKDPLIASKEEILAKRKLAQMLMQQGSDTSPVQSWTQGAARLAQALDGAITDYQATKADRHAQSEGKKIGESLFGGAGIGAASPAPVAAAPAAAPSPTVSSDAQQANNLSAPGNIPEGMRASSGLLKMIEDQNAQAGLPAGYLSRTAQIESGMNPGAKNPNSSASGLFQFIDSTRKQYGGFNPMDPAASTEAAARLASDNKAILARAIGREPTAGELYLAHQQGAGGASKLLANPNARAADLVGSDAVRLNGGNPNMTAGEFSAKWTGKFGEGQQPAAAPAQPIQVAQASQAAQASDNGPSLAQLLAARNNPAFDRAPAGTQALVNALIQKKVTQETKDPLDQEKKRLEIRQLNSQLGTADLEREGKLLANKKAQRELDGKGFRSLVTDADRAAAGVPKDYTGAVQIDRDGALHFPGKAGVEVNNNSEKELDKERGKGLAKRFNDIADEGAKAQEDAVSFARFGDLLGSVQTGNSTAIKEKVRQLTGVALDPNTDNVQALNAAIQHLAPRLRVPGSGAQSDRELGNFLASIPSLMGTPGGNQKILETLQGAVEYKQKRAAIAQAWQLGEISGKDAQKQIDTIASPYATKKAQGDAAAPGPDGWQDMGGGIRIREKGAR